MIKSTQLVAMTLNERLFELGLLAKFEQALEQWNEEALREIFVQIELPDYDLSQLEVLR